MKPSASLVKYSNPIVVTDENAFQSMLVTANGRIQKLQSGGLVTGVNMLNQMLPPRLWKSEDGKLWMQFISSTPATPSDVLKLRDNLDCALKTNDAKEKGGICSVRHDLYSSAFNEVMRQESIKCAERGLLLMRIREEIKMTLSAYRTMNESTLAHGARKKIQTESKRIELNKILGEKQAEKDMLVKRKTEIFEQLEELKLENQELTVLDDEHKSRLEKLRHDIDRLKKGLLEKYEVDTSKIENFATKSIT